MHVRFGANLKRDARSGSLGIVYGLGTSLNVGAHTVVVARSVGGEVGEAVESDGVLGRRKPSGGREPIDAALGDVIGRLCAEKEAITTDDSISGECRALCSKSEPGREKERGRSTRTLKTSKTARECRPGCLYAAPRRTDFVFFSGLRMVVVSSLRPLAIWFSSSI